MIHVIAKVIEVTKAHLTQMKLDTFENFKVWGFEQDIFQFDVETNVTNSIIENRFRTLQFGEYAPSKLEKTQWVIEWTLLSSEQQQWILDFIADPKRKKIIQNVVFEQGCLLNYGVVLENVEDTMINEKIIYTGYGAVLDEEGATFFSLESIGRRRLGLELDKTYQLLFGPENPLTGGHILYAAQDVMPLDEICTQQHLELDKQYTEVGDAPRTVFNHLPTLENEAVLAFGEISWNGLKIDKEKWIKNAEEAQPIVDKYKHVLEDFLFSDEVLYKRCVELGYINLEDKVEMNWKSPSQKRDILGFAFPDLPGATKPIIKKYLRDTKEIHGTAAYGVLNELADGNYEPFFELLVTHCRDFLIEREYLIPAGTLRINWNSSIQVLALLVAVKKSLTSTSKETINKLGHPIGFAILDYRDAKMLTTTFGVDFLEKVDADGKVRTRFNQILETGRVSSSKPNMQQIPVIDDDDPTVANKYRNCFIPDNDSQVFVDSDYSSQELVIIASLSQDPVWMEALKLGHDLHSLCAELVHGKEWDDLALPTCKFTKERQKCKCPGHARLRTGIKTINFGLAYGMSQFKLAATLKIDVKAAEALIDKYFKTFPKIGGKLTSLGRFAVRNGYIMTLAPYFRKRWYPMWDQVRESIDYHLGGIEHNPMLGSIERTGKNTPIQGGSADMTKLALVLIRRYINDNGLRDIVKLVMQVHDQVTTLSNKDYAEKWGVTLTELMEIAAKVVIPSGLLKAETNITDRWSK